MTKPPPTEQSAPTAAKPTALKELRSIEYDLACVIVPSLVNDDKIRVRMGENLSKLNSLQERLRSIEPALEASSPDSTRAKFALEPTIPIFKVVDELRALTSYPFDPHWKVSNKKRMEKVLETVSKYAEELNRLAALSDTPNSNRKPSEDSKTERE